LNKPLLSSICYEGSKLHAYRAHDASYDEISAFLFAANTED